MAERKIMWYALQNDDYDAWDNGTEDRDEAIKMLKEQGGGLIAFIDGDVCIEEITFEEVEE